MLRILGVAVLALMFCAGCDPGSSTRDVQRVVTSRDWARLKMDEASANNALRAHIATTGQQPSTVEECQSALGLRTLPDGLAWSFDAGAGSLKIIELRPAGQ